MLGPRCLAQFSKTRNGLAILLATGAMLAAQASASDPGNLRSPHGEGVVTEGSSHQTAARSRPARRSVRAPRSLRLGTRTATSIRIAWRAPVSGARGYTAYLNRKVAGRTGRRSFTFTGLACGRAYIVGVSARGTRRGASRIVARVVRTNACPPSAPGAGGAFPIGSGGAGLPPRLPASTGASFYVATTGSDANPGTAGEPWRTIGKAVRSLAPGQSAIVRGGTYNESVTLDRGGTAASPITIRNAPGETPVIRATQSMALDMVRGAAFVRLQGLVFEGATGSSTTNVYAETGAHDIELFACEIRGSARQGFYSDPGTSSVHIIASNIHDNGGSGPGGLDHNVYIQGSNHVIASSVVRAAKNGYGIQIYPSNSNIIVAANTVVDNAEGGIIVGSDGGGTTSGARIVGNILAYNGGPGLSTYWGGSQGSDNLERSNIGYGNALQDLAGTAISHQAQLLADPLFVNRAAGDLRLSPNSPARNRNEPDFTPATDVAGNPRPGGAGPDLGAYED